MAENNPLNFSDLFDPENRQSLDEFIKGIESVAKSYNKATQSIISDSKELQEQSGKLGTSIKTNEDIAKATIESVKKLDVSTEKGRDGVEKYAKETEDLANTQKKLQTNLAQTNKSIDNLKGKLKQAKKTELELITIQSKAIVIQRNQNDLRKKEIKTRKRQIKDSGQLSDEIARLSKERSILLKISTKVVEASQKSNKFSKDLIGLTEEQEIRLGELNIQIKEAQNERTSLTKVIIAENKESVALGNSYQNLIDRNSLLVKQLGKIQDPLGEGAEEFTRLSTTVKDNTETLKVLDQQMGRNFRNVGNYKQAIEEAKIETKDYESVLDKIGSTIPGFTTAMALLTAITGKNNKATEKNTKEIKQNTKALDKNEEAIEESTEATEENTEATEGSAKATGRFGKTIKRIGKIIKKSPLIILAALLTGIAASFGKTNEGARSSAGVMAQLGAQLNVVIGRLGQIGSGVIDVVKGIFEINFSALFLNLGKALGNIYIGIGNLFITALNKGLSKIGVEIGKIDELAFEKISDTDTLSDGLDKIANSMNGIADELDNAGTNAKRYAEFMFDLELAGAKVLANNQKLLAEEERLKSIRDDDKKSFTDRIRANNLLLKVERERATEELRSAKARLKLEEEFLATIPENLRGVEQITKVEEARIKVYESQERSRKIEREAIIKNGQLINAQQRESFELQEEISRERLQDIEEGSAEELEIRKDVLRNKANIELQSETENSQRRKIIILRLLNDLQDLEEEFVETFNPTERLNEQLERALKDLEMMSNRVELDIDTSQVEELTELTKELQALDEDDKLSDKERLARKEKLLSRITELEKDAIRDRRNIINDELKARKNEINVILNQIDEGDKEQVALKEELLNDLIDIEKQITALEKEELDERVENTREKTKEEIAIRKAANEQLKQSIGQIAQEGTNLVNALFDKEIAVGEARLSEQQRRGALEIALAGDNFKRKGEIAQINFDREEKLRREIIKKQREQAIFNKAVSIAEIGINTAVAISKSVAAFPLTGGAPFSIAAAVLGALQIATVIATPIPQFEKGTLSAPEGIAITDEKGAEVHTDKHGKIKDLGSSKGPRLKHLKKGDKIFNAEKSKGIIGMLRDNENSELSKMTMGGMEDANRLMSNIQVDQNGGLTEQEMFNAVSRAVKDLPINKFIWDENGYHKSRKQGDTTINYINDTQLGN